MPRPARIRFAHQVLILQIGVVVLVAVTGYGMAAWVQWGELRHQYGWRALTLARAVASDPVIGDAVASGDPQGVVEDRAERFREATGALFVVVTDRHGIRLAHPNRAEIGRRVSTDPSAALSGHEVIVFERGTLGLSARGKVPLHDHVGSLVGEVSVGFDAGEIDRRVHRTLAVAAGFAAGTVLLGVAASAGIGRRLKRQTLGLEPHELAELVQEREAVLHGISEGVLALDDGGRVTVCNEEAARLLDVTPARHTAVADLPVTGRLRAVLEGEEVPPNLFVVSGDRVLVVNRREVSHGGRRLGAVISLRDRTDVESLARELDAVRTLFDALRAQRHEYANRLHTLSGLLQLGHYEEAAGYIRALAEVPAAKEEPPGTVPDPYLGAFLAAKAAVAAEKGVELEIAETTWVPGRVSEPLDVTTVLGNLVENALEAARLGRRRPARVEVELLGDGHDLHVTVADSGEGVPEELKEAIFRDGVSTRQADGGRPRGLGLALARTAARARGGDIVLVDPGEDEVGAVFVARLPEVLN
ncbi:ATP-binding protein [Actinoallomurus iriomotensis]|uniref:histidine kinase n=1 Tax=Actinoallomurus iriomotensis TaxID=478107 RepID=A0A9W6RGA1_9ACTN|nr:sensor histidine kinase [Actinoallomurus iriomotensis]GLY75401.1 histidine kinase [Actinoallomurus iriomotensis]